uniref:Transposase n=1 Tax=Romanomermis culicivorax TaxID=13658 RepID=A0A915IJI6_ROMCU
MDICRIRMSIYIFGGCTSPSYKERCDSLFRFVNLPQTLEELCWRNIVNLTRNFQFLKDPNVNRRILFSFSLPRKFIERLFRILKQVTKLCMHTRARMTGEKTLQTIPSIG